MKSFCNHDVLDFSDDFTDEQLYWLGWLSSDGYVYKTKKNDYNICLELQFGDKELLERFRTFFNSNPVLYKKQHNTYRTRFTSNKIGEILVSLGITERKSLTLKINQNLSSKRLFWRGYFEGNGCLSKHKATNSWQFHIIAGSYDLLLQWANFIKLPISYIKRTKTCYIFRISKKSEVIRILHTLYDGSTPDLRLERKYLLVDEALGDLDPNYALQWLQAKYGKGF
jgi:hypothetical protein